MKKNGLNTRLIGFLLICAMVLCTINVPLAAVSEGAAVLSGSSGEPVYLYGNAPISEFDFSGKEELTTQWNGADDLVFGGTWYARKSLPDGITMLNGGTGKTLVLAKDANDEQTDPGHGKPTRYALEFISGDEKLKDAVSIKEPEGVLRINYDALAEPGEAVFRMFR